GDGVRSVAARGGVDPQQRAEQLGRVAGAPFRGAAGTAVAEGDVQHPVGTAGEVAAVVVAVRLLDDQQHPLGGDVEGAVGSDRVLGDDRVALVVRVVQVGERA